MKLQTNKDISFAFFGTPEVASTTLQRLIENGYVPKVVITNPDRPAGRGMQITPSPVKIIAEDNNIPVLTPEKLDKEFVTKLFDYNLDLSIVVAYGHLLKEDLINLPTHGTLNIHYSLLPKYRGASPLESALLHGEKQTGISIQKMVLAMDAGNIVAEHIVDISSDTTKNDLRNELIEAGANLLVEIIPQYINGELNEKIQDESEATYCKKIDKQDGEINEYGDGVKNWNKYRAYYGWPGVYFFKDGKRIKITKARLENGKFIIEKVIPEGKKEIDFNILK